MSARPQAARPDIPAPEILDGYRRELTGYCYRMLGSSFDADDAVQETLIKAWRGTDGFEGRSSVRAWVYRIATNVCLDMLRSKGRKALPMEMGPSCPPVEASLAKVLPEGTWVSPIADRRVFPAAADPADVAVERESIRLAFVAALQRLPARQRAVLILCEVLRWEAGEAAGLLDTSAAAVNSALQRARATLASLEAGPAPTPAGKSAAELARDDELLRRYAAAFESYDVEALVSLLREDATQCMPPLAMWLQGRDDIVRWMLGPGAQCRNSRVLPAPRSNGCVALAQYRVDPAGGYFPWGLHVLETSEGLVSGINTFLASPDGGRLFPAFDLPAHLPAADPRVRPGQFQ